MTYRAALGLRGVAILAVAPGSAAEAAGLRGVAVSRGEATPGDVIVSVNARKMDGTDKPGALLDDQKVGDTVQLGIVSQGRERTITVKLQAGDDR